METTGTGTGTGVSPYHLLFEGLSLLPISVYLLFAFLVSTILVYNLLQIHIIGDIFSHFEGNYVSLTFDSSSDLYRQVVSNCHLLHRRYFTTPWLSSPHLQTMLLHFLVKTHNFSYKRELFIPSDGGTIALDWLMNFEERRFQVNGDNGVAKMAPIVIVIPGLASDSDTPYIKYITYEMAKYGWNVVVINHRGLGGVPLTSDCIYTGGWTEDLREVVNCLYSRRPETPIFAIGTSLGANILVKYLGEDGDNVPVAGAASISNPWDLLMGDRFFRRGLMQRLYYRVLAKDLKDFAKLHRVVYACIGDWEGIEKAQSVGDFNKSTAKITGKFETVDTFHRWASSSRLVTNVKIPLVCINAIDDPICTNEAIPWDECRWVRIIEEYFSVLHSSSLMKRKTSTSSSNTHNK